MDHPVYLCIQMQLKTMLCNTLTTRFLYNTKLKSNIKYIQIQGQSPHNPPPYELQNFRRRELNSYSGLRTAFLFLDCGTLTKQSPRFFRKVSHYPEVFKILRLEALITVQLRVLFFRGVTLCLWVRSSRLIIGS